MAKVYAGIGSRAIPGQLFPLVLHVAFCLAREGYLCRTGGAEGSDELWRQGAERGATGFGEVVRLHLPWLGFNGHPAGHLPTPEAFAMAERFHPNWGALSPAVRKLMARNSHQVLGEDLQTQVDCVWCWTPGGRIQGGTGQALRIARHYGIPVFNLGCMTVEDVDRELGTLIGGV